MNQLPTGGAFTVQVNRELFVLGSEDVRQVIAKAIDSLTFISVRGAQHINDGRNDLYFIVAVTDFTNSKNLAAVAKQLTAIESPNVHKILYVLKPTLIGPTEMLFAAEIGANYVAADVERNAELRKYVKRIALQAEQLGSITHFENEVTRLVRKQDFKGLSALDDRLSELNKTSEAVLRLRAVVNFRLGKFSRFEHFLKRVLQVNPQNLWAASELGKHFLRMRRPREGIALLEKLSRFHNLNPERQLTLGNAYLNTGDHERAEQSFEKGLVLDPDDSRLEEGMAKVKVLQGDSAGALEILHDTVFSDGVISFLNMRAIMFIKLGQYEEGYNLYRRALQHSPDNATMKAKLHYNFGLGYVRNNQPQDAVAEFEHSVRLGGKKFQRARSPLEMTRKIITGKQHHADVSAHLTDDFRFEEFNKDEITSFDKKISTAS